jgi:hypothetical protein
MYSPHDKVEGNLVFKSKLRTIMILTAAEDSL